jgi:hypothetical protein
MELIKQMLRFDRVARRVDVYGKLPRQRLYGWDEMVAMPAAKFDGIILIGHGRREPYFDTEQSCVNRLLGDAPNLRWIFDIGGPNIVLAGGSVARVCAMQGRGSRSDVDLFFWGLSENEATARLEAIVEMFGNRITHIHRSANAVTIVDDRFKSYQFIQRLYESPDQIIGGFDVQLCMVLYSPATGLRFTLAGAFAMRHRLNVMDPSRRSLNYEERLYKFAHLAPTALLLRDQRRDHLARGMRLGRIKTCRTQRESEIHYVEGQYGERPENQDYAQSITSHRAGRYSKLFINVRLLVGGREDLIVWKGAKFGAVPARDELFPNARQIRDFYSAQLLFRRTTWRRWIGEQWRGNDSLVRAVSNYRSALRAAYEDLGHEDDTRRLAWITLPPDVTVVLTRVAEEQMADVERGIDAYMLGGQLMRPLRWATINPGGQGKMLTGSVMAGRQSLPLEDLYGEEKGYDVSLSFGTTMRVIFERARRADGEPSTARRVPRVILRIIEDWMVYFSVADCPRRLGLP